MSSNGNQMHDEPRQPEPDAAPAYVLSDEEMAEGEQTEIRR